MGPIDYVVIAAILLIVGGATAYIIKAKKSGKKCIGCPYSSSCGKDRQGKSSCGGSCEGCNGCHDDDGQ